jgi:hypothetical protein
MTWPDDYRTWLHAVTALEETTPSDCMLAVAISRQLAYGHGDLTVESVKAVCFGDICTLREQFRKLVRLGVLGVVRKCHGPICATFELRYPEPACVPH